jgi:MFS family permease
MVSNLGIWMQVVGAQWLMGNLGGTALQISLVQAAITLPVFLMALPAGALGDIVDRRRLLLVSQGLMMSAAGALALVTLTGGITPWLLLGLTFALALGAGLSAPSWQSVVPELVERQEIPLAAALSGVNMNVSRAIGPALGGVVVATAGAGWTFALNAASFLGVIAVLVRWRRPPAERVLGPEHIVAAMRSGVGYARNAPGLIAVMVRGLLFAFLAGALWAVLPVFARNDLHLGSAGYGLLLADVGLGAVLGAVMVARVHKRRSTGELVTAATITFAVACAMCAIFPSVAPAALALVLAGTGWVGATTTLNTTTITVLPGWVRSRGLALYALVFQGGLALGAVVWGVVTQFGGARTALGAVAGGLVLSLAAGRRWHLPAAVRPEVAPYLWPVEPPLVIEPNPAAGPVLVTVEYRVPAHRHTNFRTRMRAVGRARKRTGAERWGLFQDGADPECFVESFLVGTWEEHLRQHLERQTAGDRAAHEKAVALTTEVGPERVRHLFFAYDD